MIGFFFTSVAVNLVSKLGEYLFTPIGHQVGYVLCYKSYVKDLENEFRELETAKERVQCSVNEAQYDGKLIHTDVEDWLKSVTKEADEAQHLLEHGKSAQNSCICGWIPNPLVRHPISRKVKETTKVIQGLYEKSRDSNFKKVYYEKTPTGIVTTATFATRSVDKKEDALESRASIIENVMKAITDDKVHVIGVYGPGGVGKSKLLEDVKRRVRGEKLFDEVVMANISRNPDLKRIQGEIADALGLKLNNVETVLGRADYLRRRLEQDPTKNILIILDNLWKKLELNKVGIPCGDDNKVRGCKLLLTSRFRDVLCIEMGSDQEFQVNELKHGEARRLFERTIGDRVNYLDFESLVDGVVKNCGGLPLFIVSLAKRLKHGDLAAWRNALYIEESDIKSQVELHYRDLKDDRIRLVFLVCALDSGRTSRRDFLIYCMGLGLYEKYKRTIENARDRLMLDLHSLRDSSLLLDCDDKGFSRMHDIFVDVAISIASTEWNALVGRKGDGFKKWSKDELRKCTAISFPSVGIEELPEKLDCPNLKMLLLIEHETSLKIPPSFFESMEKLQVLDISGFSFTSLPSSIELLQNLKSLCLDQCHLEDVTVIGKLKGLQFLSFLHSTITRLPKEIGGLTELRFLDLRGCTTLKVIELGMLSSLVNLEELYMEDSFGQWEDEDKAPRSNASLAELKNMKNLSTLFITIPHSVTLSRDLPFGKLNEYKIQIGEVWGWLGKHNQSRTLKLKLDSGNLLHEEWVHKCLHRTQDLHLDGLQDGNDSIHDLCVEGFQELKHLHVQNSPSFQYVVHSTEIVQCTAFTKLESFFLKNLNNLEKICRGRLALESFSMLKIVRVDNCGKIKHLFPLSMTRILSQLEEIEVGRCHLMQQIVVDGEAEDGDEIDEDPKVKSCNLRKLTLRHLPKMTSFYKLADYSVDLFDAEQLMKLQSLEAITIERCQLIRGVFDLEGLTVSGEVEILLRLRELTLSDLSSLGHIWNKNPRRASCFRNLRTLKVQNCENLRFLFSSSMAKALRQIKEIKIVSCELMEEIIDVQEEELEEAKTTDTLKFPMLTSLSLEKLPNLMTFSHEKYDIHCPSLTRLTICRCPKMMTFSSFERKQQLMKADTGLQQAFDHINYGLSLHSFFNEKVEFPNMESMKILHMDIMEKIWLDDLASNAFSKLKTLVVQYCHKLSSIFSSYTMLTRFQSLEKIVITDCESLEVVFHIQEFNFNEARSTSTFMLKELVLMRLPKMKHVWSGLSQGGLSLRSLRCMKVTECGSLKSLFPNLVAKSMTQLEELLVRSCGVEQIITKEDGVGMRPGNLFFPRLIDLRLRELPELRSFYENSHTSTWPLLKVLRVRHCGKMRSFSSACEIESCQGTINNKNQPVLFSSEKVIPHLKALTLVREDIEMLQHYFFDNLKDLALGCYHDENVAFPSDFLLHRFPNLEILSVICCSFEEVFPEDASRHGESTPSGGLTNVEKPLKAPKNLKRFELFYLQNLKRVWKDGSLMAEILKQIESLFIWGCPSLSVVLPSLTSFKRLKWLEVKDCAGLGHMGTCSAVTSLMHLTWLALRNCDMMENVVTDDGNRAEEISFPKLKMLILDDLPSIESFSPTNCPFKFPLLKHVVITQCPKMNEFCKGALRTPKLDKVFLSEEDDEGYWEGDLNTTIQTLST